jgi:hypothetical protein
MGLTKWIFTNGKGSIGETTRVWSKAFTKNYTGDIEESFEMTFSIYRLSLLTARVPNFDSDPYVVIMDSEKCLASFIFQLVCEPVEVRKALILKQRTFDIALEVIYEQVKAVAPKFIKSTFQEFRSKAYQYLNL